MANDADHWKIARVLDRYAEALDTRRWELLSEVFVPELEFDFGEWTVTSREEAVATIRTYLDGCGPTQHLLGNYRIDVDGDAARTRVYVRAFHIGIGVLGLVVTRLGLRLDVQRRCSSSRSKCKS